MALILDATIAIARLLRDRPGTPYADAAVERGGSESLVVPDLFWHEVRSALLVAEHQGRAEDGMMEECMADLRKLSIETDGHQVDEQVGAMARRHRLRGYDAAYLETAKRRGAKLATLDKKLEKAATAEGVLANALL